MFDVGQKVVCIDGTFPHSVLLYLRNLPHEGTVYTVRDIIPAQGWQEQDGVPGPETCAVLLAEVVNPPAPHRKQWGECGFAPNRFRELTPEEERERAAASIAQPVHINCRCVIIP